MREVVHNLNADLITGKRTFGEIQDTRLGKHFKRSYYQDDKACRVDVVRLADLLSFRKAEDTSAANKKKGITDPPMEVGSDQRG